MYFLHVSLTSFYFCSVIKNLFNRYQFPKMIWNSILTNPAKIQQVVIINVIVTLITTRLLFTVSVMLQFTMSNDIEMPNVSVAHSKQYYRLILAIHYYMLPMLFVESSKLLLAAPDCLDVLTTAAGPDVRDCYQHRGHRH